MTREGKAVQVKRGIYAVFLSTLLICVVLLTGCGGSAIAGTWSSADGSEVLVFENDGTCSVPFTYDAGWLESCDRYSIESDGTLVLSSSKGNIDAERYKKQDSEEAVQNDGGYYLSGNTLVLRDFRTVRTYTRQ